jgi:hypothetical protein
MIIFGVRCEIKNIVSALVKVNKAGAQTTQFLGAIKV